MYIYVVGYRGGYWTDDTETPRLAYFNVKAHVRANRAKAALARKEEKEQERLNNPRKVRSDKGQPRKPKT